MHDLYSVMESEDTVAQGHSC